MDANSAYRLEDAGRLSELDGFKLLMMEQPLNWDDIHAHAKLQAQIQTPICLDECIHNAKHALTAIEQRACQIINIELGRVGGHTEARRVQEVCRYHSIPVRCGGTLESGIGRAHNIAMSTLEGFTLPGDVSASKRYWDEDIIKPEVEVRIEGHDPCSQSTRSRIFSKTRSNRTPYGAHHQLERAAGNRVGQMTRGTRQGSLRFGHPSCSQLKQASRLR